MRETKSIFYNDEKPETRIRFSLMHELGHILLDSEDEFAANVFASNILAPRIAIQYSSKNYKDVMNLFGLSEEAANIAFNDYKRWRLYIVNHNNKMSVNDQALYQHFYNAKVQKFVYKSNECIFCGRKLYNTFDRECGVCMLPRYAPQSYSELDRQLIVAENTWLYGE
ncbi:ImmA/IrrE family metallo-endopeptidase [Anaerosporobacter sp.]